MSIASVGLCGCGNMGSAIAARLASRVSLTVYDVDLERRATVASSNDVRAVTRPAELANQADAVVLSLPNAAISAAVVHELIGAMHRGSTIVETSTVSPEEVRALEPVCRDAGVGLIDAAILAGVGQMRSGGAALLLGGSDDAIAEAAPVLDAIAPEQLCLGALGSGMAAKVANNAVSHAVMVVLIEATALASASGVSPSRFVELLGREDAGLLRPLTHRLRERVLTGDYEGGMPTEAALKDSNLAIALAKETGVPIFAIEAAHQPYERAVEAGYGRDDYASLARLWERWTNRTLGSDA